jgi:hypothetical protein
MGGKDSDTFRFFKVEPVSWIVIDDNHNDTGKLLISEKLLSTCLYYDFDKTEQRILDDKLINPNDYKESRIYAYLNGLVYKNSFGGGINEITDFEGKGFLQLTFSRSAISDYICDGELNLLSKDQADKLQADELQKDFLRAGSTDYALACGLNTNVPWSSEEGYFGSWWLQTECEDSDIDDSDIDDSNDSVFIYHPDSVDFKKETVNVTGIGVRPVLILKEN